MKIQMSICKLKKEKSGCINTTKMDLEIQHVPPPHLLNGKFFAVGVHPYNQIPHFDLKSDLISPRSILNKSYIGCHPFGR